MHVDQIKTSGGKNKQLLLTTRLSEFYSGILYRQI